MYADSHKNQYSENVSFISHAIQCANLAKKAGETDKIVCACLLHDIGMLVGKDNTNGCGDSFHGQKGGQFLFDLGFEEEICTLISMHTQAKRYLVYRYPNYIENLSKASKQTLKKQGGKMNKEEAERFEQHPLFRPLVRMRFYDDEAKKKLQTPRHLDNWNYLIKKFSPKSHL
jgi:predicted HD phosphohydrolase